MTATIPDRFVGETRKDIDDIKKHQATIETEFLAMLGTMDQRLTMLNERVSLMDERMARRFDDLDRRFDDLEKLIRDGVNGRGS